MNAAEMNAERATYAVAPVWRSPVLALLWKEWRESWWLLLAALVVPALTLVIWRIGRCNAEGLLFFPPIVVALLCGSRTFAAELARGTANFQNERPAEQALVWKVKVLLPAGALIVGLLLFTAVALAPGVRPILVNQFAACLFDCFFICLLPGLAVLVGFAVATLASVLLDRPITALATAFVVCFGLGFGQIATVSEILEALDEARPGLAAEFELFLDSAPGLCLIAAVLLVEFLIPLALSRVVFIHWRRD